MMDLSFYFKSKFQAFFDWKWFKSYNSFSFSVNCVGATFLIVVLIKLRLKYGATSKFNPLVRSEVTYFKLTIVLGGLTPRFTSFLHDRARHCSTLYAPVVSLFG
jgi:hypothetical protein